MHISQRSRGVDMRFGVRNDRVNLQSMFQLDMFNLLYSVNSTDIIQNMQMQITQDGRAADITMLFYPLFKDCGVPQYYMNLGTRPDTTATETTYSMTMRQENNTAPTMQEGARSVPKQEGVRRAPKPMPITNIDIRVEFLTPTSATCHLSVAMDPNVRPIPQQDKMVTVIFKKMFGRLKEFIERA